MNPKNKKRSRSRQVSPTEVLQEPGETAPAPRAQRVINGLVKLEDSKVLSSVGFCPGDDATGDLLVIFTSGRVYLYRDVPIGVYVELLNAESRGSYFAKNVRDVYEYESYESRIRVLVD